MAVMAFVLPSRSEFQYFALYDSALWDNDVYVCGTQCGSGQPYWLVVSNGFNLHAMLKNIVLFFPL